MNRHVFAIAARAALMLFVALVLTGCGKTEPVGGPPVKGHAQDTSKAHPEVVAPELKKELAVDLGDGVAMQLILILPGAFTMGVGGEAHNVTITKPYYLGKYPVTQEQWEKVMGNNPSRFKGARNPVDSVSWDDCQNFIAKLKEKLPGHVFRLPTEAEWEYASCAGATTEYGSSDSEALLGEYAWFLSNARDTTHPVGQKKPNAWGLYDMDGNVWEWCADWYAEHAVVDQTDPVGPALGEWRVLRGRSWCCGPGCRRTACRNNRFPDSRANIFGLRCAIVVSASAR